MNPKIKQILLQVVPMAGEDGDLLPSLHTPEDIERFAQLIIRKCCEVVRYVDDVEIKKHFGFEE